MRVYYFGCNKQSGHYMHSQGMNTAGDADLFQDTNPWSWSVDGGLCPDGFRGMASQTEGKALIHQKDNWTALAFWDRSVDKRGNSNSCFIAEGLHNFEEMVALAKENFPGVMNRFNFAIVDASKPA